MTELREFTGLCGVWVGHDKRRALSTILTDKKKKSLLMSTRACAAFLVAICTITGSGIHASVVSLNQWYVQKSSFCSGDVQLFRNVIIIVCN